ncbi:MAG TPA: hypothetical protein VHR97_01655 [Candidatus Baltobacteraceae bacterium]|jgi:hypothetical protein|nr:hypothetical protein [Candidatus Baltobacteraceae bacterium]
MADLSPEVGVDTDPLDYEEVAGHQENVEDIVEELFVGSDYDSIYGMIAKKSMRRAAMLDKNLSISKAIRKVMIGIEIFASEHGCKPDDLDVMAKMTFDGQIVVSLRRA